MNPESSLVVPLVQLVESQHLLFVGGWKFKASPEQLYEYSSMVERGSDKAEMGVRFTLLVILASVVEVGFYPTIRNWN